MSIKTQFKKFSEYAKTPEYAHAGDAGADLRLAEESQLLWARETKVFWTDIGVELPIDCVGLVLPRSSMSKQGLLIHTGVIDASYRGNIGVTITNLTNKNVNIERNQKIAQLVILPCIVAHFVEVENLSETDRGAAGYGSTGK